MKYSFKAKLIELQNVFLKIYEWNFLEVKHIMPLLLKTKSFLNLFYVMKTNAVINRKPVLIEYWLSLPAWRVYNTILVLQHVVAYRSFSYRTSLFLFLFTVSRYHVSDVIMWGNKIQNLQHRFWCVADHEEDVQL